MALGPGRGLGDEPRTSPQPQSRPSTPGPGGRSDGGATWPARSPAPRPRGLLQMAASGRPLGLRPAAASTPGDVGCCGTRALCSRTSGAAGAPPIRSPEDVSPAGPGPPSSATHPDELPAASTTSAAPRGAPAFPQPAPPLASASGHPGVLGSSADCPLSGPRSPLRRGMLCPGREPGLGVEAKRWVGLTPNPQARAAPGGGRPHGADLRETRASFFSNITNSAARARGVGAGGLGLGACLRPRPRLRLLLSPGRASAPLALGSAPAPCRPSPRGPASPETVY